MTSAAERPGGGGGSVAGPVTRQLGMLVPDFETIRRHRPVAAPLVLILVLSVTAVASIRPYLADAFAGPDAGLSWRGVEAWLWLTALLSPALIGAKALALAVTCWSLLALLGRSVSFRALSSIYLYGEALLALHGVATALVLHLRGPGAVSAPGELYVRMGLEAVVPPGSAVLDAVARGTTVFHLLWFLFLAVALPRVVGLSGRTGALAAAVSWLGVLTVAAVRAMALG